MKQIFTILAAVLIFTGMHAQAPEKISYQAVVRDASDKLVTNQAVGMQISILQSSAVGTPVYVETQVPTTNANGLVSIEIGNGTLVSGDFLAISWENGPYFLKTETDLTGGTTYTISGTIQLLSVPYALHSKTAESVTGTITETDPVFGISVASGISLADTANWNNKLNAEIDGSVTNEIQSISRTGLTVTLSNGGGTFTDSVYVFTGDMQNQNIYNLADPVDNQDAATKAYIDHKFDMLSIANQGLTDYDGNHYSTILIGNQIWMAENLKTIKYNDGTPITKVTDTTSWGNLSTAAYCWYYNDSASYASLYGALYNWYTINTGNLCPLGWHVPTHEEWTTLTDYLGGESVAGGKLKEGGTTHWNSPNTGATNESGFAALPGGHRDLNGYFGDLSNSGYFWSSTTYSSINAWYRVMCFLNSVASSPNLNKRSGFSVRCLRD